ncbi:MAG TPA: glycosyltransferase family 1 protein [Blastocatellia bacterium]|nr:glycosyltransferase family 1 protein [Blastocatellia bacterium]
MKEQEIRTQHQGQNLTQPGGEAKGSAAADLWQSISDEIQERAVSFSPKLPDLVCFSHLRWDFVYQRPQHLLSRCARERRVFFVEEPVFDGATPELEISRRDDGLWVVVPHLPRGLDENQVAALQQSLLLDDLFLARNITNYILWYYTPMALGFTRHLEPLTIIYDCMDELSAFRGAPPNLRQLEAELLEIADVVFTGGYSLYEAKSGRHRNVHPFPSSIDGAHFRKARVIRVEPEDQVAIAHPRIGFCGVIDERMNLQLIGELADRRPDWQLVMIGPVVKIDPAELPRRANIHYLGCKQYQELPAYLSGWEVAMLPFALNESTRYISPTKTPEYLAAGLPAVSTSINDVVHPYGQQGLLKIADTGAEFVKAIEFLLGEEFDRAEWLAQVDKMLAFNCWDRTWSRMMNLVEMSVQRRRPEVVAPESLAGSPLPPIRNHPRISPSTAD